MKKILKCVFAAVMVSLLALMIPFGDLRVANAETPSLKKELKLEIELVEENDPDEFSFRVKINENPGIHSLRLELGYDSDKMMLASYTGSQVLEDELKLVTPVTEKKEEGYAYMPFVFDYQSKESTLNDTSTGAILLLRFKLKEGIKDGDHKVSFVNTKATYYDSTIKDVEEYDLKIDALKLHVLEGAVQSIELYDGIDPLISSKTLWIILISVVSGLVVIFVTAVIVVQIRKNKTRPQKIKGVYRSVKSAKRAKNSRIKKK